MPHRSSTFVFLETTLPKNSLNENYLDENDMDEEIYGNENEPISNKRTAPRKNNKKTQNGRSPAANKLVPVPVEGYKQTAIFNNKTSPKTLENYEETFTEGKVLGKGGFGEVLLVTDQSGKKYALKVLLTANPQILEEEIGLIRDLSKSPKCDPDIVCYYDSFQFMRYDPKKGKKIVAYGILMQFIDGTDLGQEINKFLKKGDTLSPSYTLFIGIWLTGVLMKLHANGYVHRDIKPNNIMLQGPKYVPILIDFGLSCDSNGNLNSHKSYANKCEAGIAGTPGFMSPELINGSFQNNLAKYYKTSDVFAVGVTLFIMINGFDPYDVDDDGRITKTNRALRAVTEKNVCLNKIIARMINLNPERRITMAQANELLIDCDAVNDNEE